MEEQKQQQTTISEVKTEDKINPVQNQENLAISQSDSKEEKPKTATEWDKFREARAIERKRAEEIEKQARKSAEEAAALKAALEAALNKQQYNAPQSQNGYDNGEETEEQRIDKKVNAALAKREIEAAKQRKEREQAEFPERLTSTYRDFNQVCSTENLDYLEYHYPEVAGAFKHSPDGFDKWASVYQTVKRLVPNADSKKDQKKAEANFNKPQSASSPTVTSTGQALTATHLDESRKASNWTRMQKAMKGLS
jgi:hypothetical protein